LILGIRYYENKNKYDGEWKDGKREGRGNLKLNYCRDIIF